MYFIQVFDTVISQHVHKALLCGVNNNIDQN